MRPRQIIAIVLLLAMAAVPGVGYADSKGLGHKGDSLHFSADAERSKPTARIASSAQPPSLSSQFFA